MKVLIVDDDSMLLELLMRLARKAGVLAEDIDLCGSLEDVVRHLTLATSVDLLITDWNIPNGDEGDEVIRLVRQSFPDVRTIVVSGNPDNCTKINALNPNLFLSKPFDVTEAIEAIAQYVKSS